MAIMIPEKPRSFEPASQEGLIFEALALLPEEKEPSTKAKRTLSYLIGLRG